MDPEILRLRAERYAKAKEIKMAEEERIQAEERERIRAEEEKIRQFESQFESLESSHCVLENLVSLEQIADLVDTLLNFLIENEELIKKSYLERASAYITDIVQKVSENKYTHFNVHDDTSVANARKIKEKLDEIVALFGLLPIEIEWMDTSDDRMIAEQLNRDLNGRRGWVNDTEDWMVGLTEAEIDSILNS